MVPSAGPTSLSRPGWCGGVCPPATPRGGPGAQRCPAGPRVCTARVTVYVCAWTLHGVRGGGSQGQVLGPGPPRGTSTPGCPSRLQSWAGPGQRAASTLVPAPSFPSCCALPRNSPCRCRPRAAAVCSLWGTLGCRGRTEATTSCPSASALPTSGGPPLVPGEDSDLAVSVFPGPQKQMSSVGSLKKTGVN